MLRGKGIYIWILKRCEGGNMTAVVDRLKQAGMTHVIPKFADGIYGNINDNDDYLPALIEGCHKEGIKVLGYHFVYGSTGEASTAIRGLQKFDFDGLIVNAEGAYRDNPNNKALAKLYMQGVKNAFPNLKIGLSTYRFPTLHRNFPFKEFLEYCDWNLPQVYWMKANGTVPEQLARTIDEYKSFPRAQMVPTGAAFAEHGWKAIPADQFIFVNEVKKHGLLACNWWEYHEAFGKHPELGEALIGAQWEVKPVGDTMFVIEMLGNMNVRDKPNGEVTGQYALRGEVYHSKERSGGWYKIDKGWISGTTQWTRITEVEDEPEPEQPLTLEERVERLEKAVFGGKA